MANPTRLQQPDPTNPSAPSNDAREHPSGRREQYLFSLRRVAALVGEPVFLIVLPVVAYYLLNYVPINQNNTLDPFYYTGYINNFKDLIQRYGFTYYSVRFGLILPAQGLAALVGPEAGYFTLRYLLALIAGVPMYYVAKRYLSPPVAVVLYTVFLSSPYVARVLLWEHPDATGMPFLLAAICLLLLEKRRSLLWDTLAGGSAAMAIHSNFFTTVIFGIFVFVYTGFWILHQRGAATLCKRLFFLAAGFVLVTIAGVLFYWRTTGHPNIFFPTFNVVLWLSKGGMKDWRVAGVGWMAAGYHVFVPVWLSLCCLCIGRWRESLAIAAMTWFGVAVTVFYYAHQFLLDADTLQLFYYFSYAAPAIFLMLGIVYQRIWERARVHRFWFVSLSLTAMILPWALRSFGMDSFRLASFRFFLESATIALVVIAVAAHWRRNSGGILAMAGVLALAVTFDSGFSWYSPVVQPRHGPDSSEMDVYRVALQFIQVVPKVHDHPGRILFWYDNRPYNSINSVQSTFLWGFSKFSQDKPLDAPRQPYFGDWQTQMLKDADLRYLGLIANSRDDIELRAAVLRSHHVPFRDVSDRELASGGYRIYFKLLELVGHEK